jgi:peptidoglycan hydrolase CwlO-like protein
MEEESSRLTKVLAVGAVAGALAIAGIAVTGCGSDDENNSANDALNNIQSQVDSAQSAVSSAATSVQEQAKSVQSEAQDQVESVQSQIQTATESNGGSGPGGY